MKVRVKEGKKGFIYGKLRNEFEKFTLKTVTAADGRVIEPELQFSDAWMEVIGESKQREVEVEDSEDESEEEAEDRPKRRGRRPSKTSE